ncbi:PqqD family protein [Streptomyces sp. NPDC021224]|uniref:PqqD family protein n=1 Tax=unclassified Streptomyces TaxID=2593676 RepID=UPI0037AE6EA3
MTGARWRPLRSAGAYTRREGDATLIEGYLDVYETNRVGAFIWSQCGGQMALDELSAVVARRYGVDGARARADVEAFVAGLRDLGFVI